MTALPFNPYTTRHPRLTIAAVLVLAACKDWLADTGAVLILGWLA